MGKNRQRMLPSNRMRSIAAVRGLLLAQSGHHDRAAARPFLEAKRTLFVYRCFRQFGALDPGFFEVWPLIEINVIVWSAGLNCLCFEC